MNSRFSPTSSKNFQGPEWNKNNITLNFANFQIKMSFCCGDINHWSARFLVRNVCHYAVGVPPQVIKITADLTSLSRIRAYPLKEEEKLFNSREVWFQKMLWCKDIDSLTNSVITKKCMWPPYWCTTSVHQHGGQ